MENQGCKDPGNRYNENILNNDGCLRFLLNPIQKIEKKKQGYLDDLIKCNKAKGVCDKRGNMENNKQKIRKNNTISPYDIQRQNGNVLSLDSSRKPAAPNLTAKVKKIIRTIHMYVKDTKDQYSSWKVGLLKKK